MSVRTVSNVAAGSDLVAAATRERVQRVIDELGYRPNAAARHLRGGRSGLIGLVLPELSSPYFAELADHVVRAAADRGRMVLVQQTDGEAEQERRLLTGVRGQSVDGVLMSPWGLSPADLRAEPGSSPVVLLGEQDAEGLLDHVTVDGEAAAREATQHLLAAGRTSIVAVGDQPHLGNGTAERRAAGYRAAMTAAGLEPRTVAVRRLHRSDGADAVRALLERPQRPDAVFCFSDQLALGALRAAMTAGLRVPDDLAVVGFDDVEDGRYATPALTTVAPDKAAIAEAALELLTSRIESPERPPQRVLAPYLLRVRESSAAATPPDSQPTSRPGTRKPRKVTSRRGTNPSRA
ncbi:LacI family transcriptional regulator [Marmoricola endophyticus]|uniref:LacI family transcriptional regulator n=1 Tax=Marmoricola endophyticus TaxID=2040280 RepID=A0A917BML6_9ACTN|nr:LacI family transcriptional regulator [Marmoricola endophyticus]